MPKLDLTIKVALINIMLEHEKNIILKATKKEFRRSLEVLYMAILRQSGEPGGPEWPSSIK